MQKEAGLSRALPATSEPQDDQLLDFQVVVHTAPAPGSGTDSRVYLALEGEHGRMQRVRPSLSHLVNTAAHALTFLPDSGVTTHRARPHRASIAAEPCARAAVHRKLLLGVVMAP